MSNFIALLPEKKVC